jgi:hypothetical protein
MKIYLITDSQYTKIGISKHPEKRLKQLQTAHPQPLTIIFEKETKNARKLEKFLHKILWQYRVKYNSEWFLISDISWLKDYIDELTTQ